MQAQSETPKTNRGEAKRPLGVRVTAEQHRVLREAAQREHLSVNSFVVQAALRAARAPDLPPSRHSSEEIASILETARKAVAAALPPDKDLLEEFLSERRLEAARE